VRVVNLKTEPYDLYIGRENITYNLEESKWANPYSLEFYSREEALSLYETYVRQSELYNQLDELEGKILGCWCAPKSCHGDILIKLYNEKRLNSLLDFS
jgi:hypothetical protein